MTYLSEKIELSVALPVRLINQVYKKNLMYTSENPHFNTIDKIILGLIGFSTLFIILKAFLDYVNGFGPFGWRWEGMVKKIETRKRRRRSRTPPRKRCRLRSIYVSDDGNLNET